jgi:hypothetical protein
MTGHEIRITLLKKKKIQTQLKVYSIKKNE